MNRQHKAEAKCLVEKKDASLSIELYLPGYEKGEVKVKVNDVGINVETDEVDGLRGELECRGFKNFIPFGKSDSKTKYFELEGISAQMIGDYLMIEVPIAKEFHPKTIAIK